MNGTHTLAACLVRAFTLRNTHQKATSMFMELVAVPDVQSTKIVLATSAIGTTFNSVPALMLINCFIAGICFFVV